MRLRGHRLPCVVVVIAAFRLAGAADVRPSWECLPEDTAALVRLPQPAEFLEAVRGRTKFGAVALAAPRLKAAWSMLVDAARRDTRGATAPDFDEQLAAYGLDPSDLQAAFRDDLGTGIVVRRRGDGLPPLVMALAWLEPGEEPATRLVTAMQRRVEERNAAGEPDAPKRIDLDMAGHEVLWMVEPILTVDTEGLDVEPQGEAFDADEFKKRLAERVEAVRERIRSGRFVQVGETHTFLTRLGSRLLAGQTIPDPAAAARRGGDGDRDFAEESGAEEARKAFEQFLAAHAESGRAPLAETLAVPGMAAALPPGLPLLDVVVDPRVLVTAYGHEPTKAALAMIGAESLGPVAWRQTLDDGRYRSGLFAALPAPRTSLMRILDQDCDAAEVPSFVTREAIDFSQISLDLGKAYETVKEYAVASGGEQTANMFTAVEMQAQGWLGAELPRVLASLGSRHWLVSYPPRVAEAFAEARQARGRDGGTQARQVADRIAVVWQITDDGPLGKILQRLAGMAGGELQEEQGFRGVRLPDGPAVFLGQDHLVVGIGADSLEKTLTAIRNPPAGEASLRESDVPRRAAELLPQEPARLFGLSDSSQSGGTLGVLCEMLRSLEPEDVEESYRELLVTAQKLVPSDDEMEGMFGVGATTLRANDHGISFQTAWEMPAP